MIFLRRADESNRVYLLGRSFAIPDHWKHRLARCEVDLRADEIRFFSLRRKDPSSQPLLITIPYHRKHQPSEVNYERSTIAEPQVFNER